MTNRYFDVTDLIEHFKGQLVASGIQRVQLEMIRAFASGADGTYRFVIDAQDQSGFQIINARLLRDLVLGIDDGRFDREGLDTLVAAIIASQQTFVANKGDIFIVLGGFWSPPTIIKSLLDRQLQGAKVGFFCHDLIPIRHPEYCDAGLSVAFKAALENICNLCDFIFTNSEYVKGDVEAYLESLNIRIPVTALPLAHELLPVKGSPEISDSIKGIIGTRYVLQVSTIEIRKNHIYSMLLWQSLLKSRPDTCPDLIWVGRPGWLVNDMMKRLNRLGKLGGKLKILNGLTDAELAALYANCAFTLYPSLAEGWGLPVAESLMAGKVPVVSNADSLPEVGGNFAYYIDPMNVSDGVRVVGKLLDDPALLKKAERRIKTAFKPRRWSDVAHKMALAFDQVETLKSDAPRQAQLLFAQGALYHADQSGRVEGSNLTRRERLELVAGFDNGWFWPEDWGRWMRGLAGGFWIDAGAPGTYTVLVRLRCFDGWRGKRVALHCPETGDEAIFPMAPGDVCDVSLTMRLPGGRTRLILRADRADAGSGPDRRQLSIGLEAFGFAAAADAQACARLQGWRTTQKPLQATAKAQGKETGLAHLSTPVGPHWITALLARTVKEGPRAFAVRALRRLSIMIAGERI